MALSLSLAAVTSSTKSVTGSLSGPIAGLPAHRLMFKSRDPYKPSLRLSRRSNTGKWQARRLHAETKAAKTVGIIVGGFIVCWFPFFTIYLARAYMCCVPGVMMKLFTWLGYANSGINPVIYCVVSRDFRRAFKAILCGCSCREEGVKSLIRQIHLPGLFEEDDGSGE